MTITLNDQDINALLSFLDDVPFKHSYPIFLYIKGKADQVAMQQQLEEQQAAAEKAALEKVRESARKKAEAAEEDYKFEVEPEPKISEGIVLFPEKEQESVAETQNN